MNVITAPTVEPITLAEVKAQLGIKATDTASDSVIVRRITEARQWAEDYMQRALMPQTHELRLNCFPHRLSSFENSILLPFPKLQSVVSIKYVDDAGIEQTLDPANYVADTYGLHGTSGLVRPAYGLSWPYAREENNAVRIQYKCGYGSSALAAAKTITAATNATPGVFTSVGHGFADGDLVLITATGMTEVSGNLYLVINKATDTFQLANLGNTAGISTAGYGVFTAGTVQRVESVMPLLLKEALLLLVGHWMNYQPQSENGAVVARVPYAVRDLFDKYTCVRYV